MSFWTLDVIRMKSLSRPMKSLSFASMTVRLPVRPSIDFLKIGSLVFLILYMVIVNHDIYWLVKLD